ncbi:hypothetical protein ACJQWK_07661 [Exserohilum turcicum]|uniref:Uncharacterized protein n=1 Tax=Exserohilum turcicum (strain 28A) TaxID=671987 RepID=R0J0X0_EXST2|nr:uncharacterized protein SETTUDRAFT_25680 [Exserohilum turcica Et28A]EOA90416.1 hypothetical protein SETTUDRAFT_25680 [Exserohilum turcica Et28A]
MPKQISKPQPVSPRRTISDDVALYRALGPEHTAEVDALCAHIKARLRTEPATELDVQSVWTLHTPEWISAVLYNIAKFDLLNVQPTGGYIHMFIHTEMLQYHGRAVARIMDMYEGHQETLRREADDTRLSKRFLAALKRVACGLFGISKSSK